MNYHCSSKRNHFIYALSYHIFSLTPACKKKKKKKNHSSIWVILQLIKFYLLDTKNFVALHFYVYI